ncbi:MAG: hypothetical protein AB2L09_08700 [Coriobacteriia bacterium]
MSRQDHRIGGALRGLEAPEHREGFFELLEERMCTEDEVSALELGEPAQATRRSRKPSRALLWVPLAAAATVLLVLAAGPLAKLLPSVGPGSVPTASAAEIRAKVAQAVQRAKALSGKLVVVDGDAEGTRGAEMTYTFVVTAEGDMRLTGRNEPEPGSVVTEERAYVAATHTESGVSIAEGSGSYAVGWRHTGLAGGAPDPHRSDLLGQHLGGLVRALLAADDPSVRETTYQARGAWVLEADVEPNLLADGSPDHVEITVDKETGLPVKSVYTSGGKLVQEVRLENLVVDPEVASDAFELAIPQEVEYWEQDAGFRPTDLGQAASVVGYKPTVPAWMPDGYELADVTVAAAGQATGKEGGNPPSQGVVSLVYRRGFDAVVITTRLTGADPALWSDPLSLGEGYIDRPEETVLSEGAYAGDTAQLELDPRGIPHLWVLGSDLVLTIAGDLTHEEFVQVAESMAR